MLRHLAAFLVTLIVATTTSTAAEISLDRPGDREFVRDSANMLTEPDQAEIVAICDKLLTDKATPIIVITIDRMSNHGGNGMRIETFARLLFDQWEIGQAELNGQLWNTGILVLVSKGDRKARIELGAGWHRDKDQFCKSIMDDQIIPHFKRQDFSGGIKAGVVALDAMARELTMPGAAPATSGSVPGPTNQVDYFQGQGQHRPQTPAWFPIAVVMLVGVAIFTAVSLYRSGASGLAWAMWAAIFAILGAILYMMATSNRHRGGGFGGGSGGGGFSGGSFGSGFSGGGGSSGSW
jgi:uncharacterized protein